MLNDYSKFIEFYTKKITGTGYLAFRDLPLILNYNKNKKALDFGCGAGRSAQYLEALGYTVTGIDIDPNMIEMAKNKIKTCDFIYCNTDKLPFHDHTFDLVFNSFVLFDISSKEEMIAVFKEMKRVCKMDGEIVSIVNSDELFTKQWLSIKNNFPQNKNLLSGNIARLFLSDLSIDIYDYYWTNADYEACFKKINCRKIDKYQPLGYTDEGYAWQDELKYPPYTIYRCKL